MAITRDEVLRRAADGFGDGLGRTPYDQDVLKGGYRTDCSGYVSRCWKLTGDWGHGFWGGLNTETLISAGAMREIHPDDLLPGDACGHCGPGTGGDAGHVVVFDRWVTHDDPDDSRHFIYEQAGGENGPVHRQINWPYPGFSGAQWKAYRFTGIEGAGEDEDMRYTSVAASGITLAAGQTRSVRFTECYANTGKFWTPPKGDAGGYSVATGPLLFIGDISVEVDDLPAGGEVHYRFVEVEVPGGDITKKHPTAELRHGAGTDYAHDTTVSGLDAKRHLWVQVYSSVAVRLTTVTCKVALSSL